MNATLPDLAGHLKRGESPRLSRRGLLGVAGTALVASSPVLRGARSLLSEGFRISGDEKRLAFVIGRKERWVIDTGAFGGRPKLRIDRRDGWIDLRLTNARYPGTDIAADFRCTITGNPGARPRFTLHFPHFDASGSALFEEWLLGMRPLGLKGGRGVLLDHGPFHLASDSFRKGKFSPDWSMMIEGENRLGVESGAGRSRSSSISSNLLLLRIPDGNEENLLEGEDLRRTRILMLREKNSWPLTPDVDRGDGWSLEYDDRSFDRIEFEGAEGPGDRRHAVMVAEGEGAIHFRPEGKNLTDATGQPFRLPLERPTLAIEAGPDGEGSWLGGSYPERGVSMRGKGFAVRIGEKKESENLFELQTTAGKLDSLVCAPTLQAATLPLKGGVVSPARPKNPGRLWFFRQLPPDETPEDGDGEVELDEEKEAIVTFPLDSVIWVLRPADMLYLGFEFINMQISSGGGSKGTTKGFAANKTVLKDAGTTPSISIIAAPSVADQIGKVSGPGSIKAAGNTTANKPYLVVHFPPQNIAEQAFWEAEDTHDEVAPENSTPAPGGTEKPLRPPVEHRIAGPSRLAFALPTTITSLPYTLADLLDWSSLVPSVVPVALPPPPPPSPTLGAVLGINSSIRGKIATRVNSGSRNTATKLAARDANPDAAAAKYSNITLKRGYINTNAAARGWTGTSQAIAEKDALIASSPSLRANSEQLGFMATENPAAKADLYLDLKAVTPEIAKPKSHQTAIEAPYRLILSPHVYAGWAHSIEPVTHDGVTELWHTRLGVRKGNGAVDEYDSYYRTVRAVWSPDYSTTGSPPSNNEPFRMPLNSRDRHELVRLSSDFTINPPSDWVPDPVGVTSLMLSSLGAWMNVRGAWEPPNPSLSIEEWKHRGTMGRDHYVRVVYKGFLFPFGNRASLIKITERKIRNFGRDGYIAYMYQRMYIVVRRPEMTWPALAQPYDGRRTPFRSIRLTTLVTPNLDQPDQPPSKIASYGDEAFWPVVDGEDFLFNVVATDWEGKNVEFSTPLAFVNNKKAFDNAAIENVADASSSWTLERRKRETSGQSLAYAPADKEGDTSFETDYIEFWYDRPTTDTGTTADAPVPGGPDPTYPPLPNDDMDMYEADQPYFYPAFHETKVRIDAVEQITGTEAFRAINLHPSYYKYGIESNQNKGQVFAELIESVDLSFNTSADKAGGLVTPNMGIAGLSRSLGTVGGNVQEIADGEFKPESFFDAALDANLLGGISLRDIVDAVNDFAGGLIKIPQMVNQKSFEDPKALLASLQSIAAAVDDVKGDVERFADIAEDLSDAIGDIENIPDAATQAAQDAAEKARQKALAIIRQVEQEAKQIIDQAKGYAESIVNKVKNIAESESLVGLLEALGLPTEMTLELKWGPMIKSWPNASQPNALMGTNALFQTLNMAGQPVC